VLACVGGRAVGGVGRFGDTHAGGGPLHVVVTRTQGTPHEPIEVATIVGEEMLRWFRDMDGFEGLLVLDSPASGATLVLTFWESLEVAERHRTARAQFRERVTSTVDVHVEEVVGYELAFAHLGPQLATSGR
jgi:heme-degrading monooxygenase HmoA